MTQAMQHDRQKVDGALVTDVDELLAGFASADDQGKAARIEALYHHYKPLAVGYAKRDRAGDVEGVVDLALFDTFRALSSLRTANDLTFRSYMFRAIQSHSIKEGRKPVPIPAEIHDIDMDPAPSFESDLIDSLHVGQLISTLPEDQRAVMTHRIIHGRTADETGLILGKQPNAVYQIQHRATKRLQRMLLMAAVLVVVIGAAIVAIRQASRQAIDSSPARPESVEQNEAPTTTIGTTTTTTQPTENTRTESTGSGQTNLNANQQPSTSQPDRAAGDAPDENATPRDTARQEAPADQDQPVPTIPADDLTSTTPDSQITTTTQSEQAQQATTAPAVVAVDDVLRLTVGQSVDFNILANDGPSIAIESATWISGLVDGLTLGEDGRLTGIPTEAGTDTIFYRLNGTNNTSDIGQVRVIVE